jgi:hypothetical protein
MRYDGIYNKDGCCAEKVTKEIDTGRDTKAQTLNARYFTQLLRSVAPASELTPVARKLPGVSSE